MIDDPLPLYVAFLEPVTDQSAYIKEPRIADKLTVLWVGGGPWSEGGL